MFCSRCGAPLTPGAAFCASCGAPAPAAAPAGSTAAVPLAGVAPVARVLAEPATSVLWGGFWRRVWAFLLDGLIVNTVLWPVRLALGLPFLFAFFRPDTEPEDLGAALGGLLLSGLLSVLGTWLYFALMESSKKQATLGKMVLGIRVTDLEGRRVSFARASGRWFAKIISGLTFGIGYLMAAFTARKQALHDMIAGTLVMRGAAGG